MGAASGTGRERFRIRHGAAASSELSVRARGEPKADGLGRLRIAAGLLHVGDCRVEVRLQMVQARVPARDVAFHASAPPLPEPEPQPSELERVRRQLPQGDTDRTAAGAVAPEENTGSEVVSVTPQAIDHRPQELVGEVL